MDYLLEPSLSLQAPPAKGGHILFNKVFSRLKLSSITRRGVTNSTSIIRKKKRRSSQVQPKVHFDDSQFTYFDPPPPVEDPPLLPQEVYYTREDYARIKQDISFTLQLIDAAGAPKDPMDFLHSSSGETLWCGRGLQEGSQETLQRRYESSTQLVRAILKEQALQKFGMVVHGPLSRLSRRMSSQDKRLARHLGLFDARVAKAILLDKEVCTATTVNLPSTVLVWDPRNRKRGDSSSTVSTLMMEDSWRESLNVEGDEDDDDKDVDDSTSFRRRSQESSEEDNEEDPSSS